MNFDAFYLIRPFLGSLLMRNDLCERLARELKAKRPDLTYTECLKIAEDDANAYMLGGTVNPSRSKRSRNREEEFLGGLILAIPVILILAFMILAAIGGARHGHP